MRIDLFPLFDEAQILDYVKIYKDIFVDSDILSENNTRIEVWINKLDDIKSVINLARLICKSKVAIIKLTLAKDGAKYAPNVPQLYTAFQDVLYSDGRYDKLGGGITEGVWIYGQLDHNKVETNEPF